MSHQFLSESWIEAARDIRHRYSGDVPVIDVVVRINVITTKVPFGDGSISAYIDTSNGSLEMELGSIEDSDLTVTTDYETARKLFVEQDPTASMQAFMAGRIKVEGDITRLMVMQTSLPQTETTEAVAAEIKAITAQVLAIASANLSVGVRRVASNAAAVAVPAPNNNAMP